MEADSISVQDGTQTLINAVVLVQDSTKYAKIESALLQYQPKQKRFDSESGRIMIYDKTENGGRLRTEVAYKKLILFTANDSVGLRIILRGME